MRPYCHDVFAHFLCDVDSAKTCDGCRLEAACNAMGIALALAGLAAQLVAEEDEWTSGYVDHDAINAHFARRAGIVLP